MRSRINDEIEVSQASPEQVVVAARLAHEVYRDTAIGAAFRTPEAVLHRWRWIMDGNPVGSRTPAPAWVATRSGAIVGHFALIPVVVAAGRREFAAAWGRDFFVVRSARGGGVGPRLVATVARSVGHVIVAGLNPAARNAYERADFRDRGRIPFYLKVLRPAEVASTVRGGGRPIVRALAGIAAAMGRSRPSSTHRKARILDSFDETFDRWWAQVEPRLACVIRRTSATMNWRYVGHPSHQYRLLTIERAGEPQGYAVVRVGVSRGLPAGFIVELLARPGDGETSADLIEAAERTLRHGSDDLAFIRANAFGSGIGAAMLGRGFVPAPSPFRWMVAFPRDGRATWDPRCTLSLNSGDSDLDFI